ncbi:hypothetical protein PLICBS_010145 [Purpureocillium lilacinum]|uniref:uncharacterized protein n=1 Tax=Purpureocillium lilacinum TaxID=33203 RepID=UPI002087C00E|nr:hypothetical protein PLICBS_010145 [Purpureocillium lilacinum]
MIKQRINDFRCPLTLDEMERLTSATGPKQCVRTCSQEYLYSFGTRLQDSLVQGCSAIGTLGIHMSSVLQQNPDDAIVARHRGSVQRPSSRVGLVVGIRAVLE